jgi:hypothetical protein
MLEQFFLGLINNGKDVALFTIVIAQLYVIVRLSMAAIGRSSTDARTAETIRTISISMEQSCERELEIVKSLGELLGRNYKQRGSK